MVEESELTEIEQLKRIYAEREMHYNMRLDAKNLYIAALEKQFEVAQEALKQLALLGNLEAEAASKGL